MQVNQGRNPDEDSMAGGRVALPRQPIHLERARNLPPESGHLCVAIRPEAVIKINRAIGTNVRRFGICTTAYDPKRPLVAAPKLALTMRDAPGRRTAGVCPFLLLTESRAFC
jgi:hypothetical protein